MGDDFLVRSVSYVFMITIFFLCFYFGDTTSSILFVSILVLSLYEWNALSVLLGNKLVSYAGYFFIVLMIISAFFLYFNNFILLIFSVFFSILTDTTAYIFGRKFGKRKFFKNISPNKTWEGFLYSTIFSMIFSFIVLYFVANKMLFIGFFVPFISNFGDLCMSFIKRKAKIKDTGSIIPGHGGILDRIDSWVFILPTISFFYFIYYL
ncbi:phosphatidate cytidylyltransferase [Anaplasmataceae bacterium AB001_6]|nr:phosphatidate cytidylyltransferase [Anaplasmataceae bacterium AB001_6]